MNNEAKGIRREIFKDFTNFLKQKECYLNYRENIMHSVRKYYEVTVKGNTNKLGFMYGIQMKIIPRNRKLDFDAAKELINYAFCWEDTPQGHNYWSKLCDEWRKLFYDKYAKYIRLLDSE